MEAAGLIIYCKPPGGLNPILNGLHVYKAMVFNLALTKCWLNFNNPPELCDSYHQKSDLSMEGEKSKLLP